MPFVMVPVPEEHVFEVMRHITRLHARDQQRPWDRDSVHDFYRNAVEDVHRSLLTIVADANAEGAAPKLTDLASSLETDMSGLLEICAYVGNQCQEMNRVPMIRSEVSAEATGSEPAWEQPRVLTMEVDVASMVQQVQSAEPSRRSDV